jgi:hypothetical protein
LRKNRSTAAGTPRNTLKLHWQMVSFTTFCDSINCKQGVDRIMFFISEQPSPSNPRRTPMAIFKKKTLTGLARTCG